MSTDAYSESELRERFEEVVVSTSDKNTKVMHLPSENGEEVPLCDRPLQSKEWREKSLDVYPLGWFENGFCDYCREKIREREERAQQETPDWVYTGEAAPSNAAEAEWADS